MNKSNVELKGGPDSINTTTVVGKTAQTVCVFKAICLFRKRNSNIISKFKII